MSPYNFIYFVRPGPKLKTLGIVCGQPYKSRVTPPDSKRVEVRFSGSLALIFRATPLHISWRLALLKGYSFLAGKDMLLQLLIIRASLDPFKCAKR